MDLLYQRKSALTFPFYQYILIYGYLYMDILFRDIYSLSTVFLLPLTYFLNAPVLCFYHVPALSGTERRPTP